MSFVNVVDTNITLCPLCPSYSSHANVADERCSASSDPFKSSDSSSSQVRDNTTTSIRYCSSLRPHRPLKIMIPQKIKVEHDDEVNMNEWNDSNRSSDTYDCTRDAIMEEACQRWWHCRAKGDDYTPPWIRLPDHLP